MIQNETLEAEYLACLRNFINGQEEEALAGAYQVGRKANIEGLGILQLLELHHSTMNSLLEQEKTHEGKFKIIRLSQKLLSESLASYEMANRGFHQTFEALIKTNADLNASKEKMEVEIAERKKAEGALTELNQTLENRVRQRTAEVARERQRFLDMLDTLPVILDIIRVDHRIEWANTAFRKALGDNVGQICHESQFARSTPCQECQAFIPLQTGQPHHWEWTLPNGRTFDIYNFPFAAADGSPAVLEMDIDITEQRHAEAKLIETSEQKAFLAQRLLNIQEEERRAIARELHDQTGQSLTVLKLMMGRIERIVPEENKLLVKDASAMTSEIIAQVRGLSLSLRPGVLDDLGLVPAMEWLFKQLQNQAGLNVHFESINIRKLPPDISTAAFRITQEAMTNVMRYAGVKEAWVQVADRDGALSLQIEDHGRGFDLTAVGANKSTGLSAMRERATLLGGSCQIVSSPGKGTIITIVLPLPSDVAVNQ